LWGYANASDRHGRHLGPEAFHFNLVAALLGALRREFQKGAELQLAGLRQFAEFKTPAKLDVSRFNGEGEIGHLMFE
jgi:hypothetical protein